jgi:hypothetical protein
VAATAPNPARTMALRLPVMDRRLRGGEGEMLRGGGVLHAEERNGEKGARAVGGAF